MVMVMRCRTTRTTKSPKLATQLNCIHSPSFSPPTLLLSSIQLDQSNQITPHRTMRARFPWCWPLMLLKPNSNPTPSPLYPSAVLRGCLISQVEWVSASQRLRVARRYPNPPSHTERYHDVTICNSTPCMLNDTATASLQTSTLGEKAWKANVSWAKTLDEANVQVILEELAAYVDPCQAMRRRTECVI